MELAFLLLLFIIAGCTSILVFLPTHRQLKETSASHNASRGEPPEIHVYDRIAAIREKRQAIELHRERLLELEERARTALAPNAARHALALSRRALEQSRDVLDFQEEHWRKLPHEFARIEWSTELRQLADRLTADIVAFTQGTRTRGNHPVSVDEFDQLMQRGERAREAAKPFLGEAWEELLAKAVQLREQLLVYNVMRRVRAFQAQPFVPESAERLGRLIGDVERLAARAPGDFGQVWSQLLGAIVQFEIQQNIQLARRYVDEIQALEGAHALYEAQGELAGVKVGLEQAALDDGLADTWRELQIMLVALSPEIDTDLVDLEYELSDVESASESLQEVEALSKAA